MWTVVSMTTLRVTCLCRWRVKNAAKVDGVYERIGEILAVSNNWDFYRGRASCLFELNVPRIVHCVGVTLPDVPMLSEVANSLKHVRVQGRRPFSKSP